MSEKRTVTLLEGGGDVALEVVVTNQKPAGISVALYGADRRKERDIGSALTLEPPDPDVFGIAATGGVAGLDGKIIGVFVAISSFDGSVDEPVSVVSILRQGGEAVTNGTIVAARTVKDGGAGVIIGYQVAVV